MLLMRVLMRMAASHSSNVMTRRVSRIKFSWPPHKAGPVHHQADVLIHPIWFFSTFIKSYLMILNTIKIDFNIMLSQEISMIKYMA